MKLSRRTILFLIVFFILSGVLAYGSTAQLSQSDAQALNSEAQGIRPTTVAIFLNNEKIALIEFIPGYGPAFGVYTSYSTGLALAAISQTNSQTNISGLESFLILLLTPIYWLEFFAYSLAIEESIAIPIAVKNRDLFRTELKWLVLSILAVVIVLFASARLEASLVSALT